MCLIDGRFVQVCEWENCKIKLGLDVDGNLWKGQVKSAREMDWQPVAFNENHAGYYPACTFTAIVATDVDFAAAGTGGDGLPYVYRSLMGGVWESANLMAGSALNGFVRATGKINQMLYDRQTRQIFLLCDNGELVTMPDCPKCVRVRRVTDCALVAGNVDAGESAGESAGEGAPKLILTNERGEKIILNSYEMTQVRASYSYVTGRLQKGGWLVDLRGKRRDGTKQGGRPKSVEAGAMQNEFTTGISPEQILHMNLEEMEEWLEEQPRETFLAFLCEYGTQADEAAHYARRRHFPQAYSLGGAGELFHVK